MNSKGDGVNEREVQEAKVKAVLGAEKEGGGTQKKRCQGGTEKKDVRGATAKKKRC